MIVFIRDPESDLLFPENQIQNYPTINNYVFPDVSCIQIFRPELSTHFIYLVHGCYLYHSSPLI